MDDAPFKFWTPIDLASIPALTDPDVCGCEYDAEMNVVTLFWQGAYDVDLDRIDRPEDLMWVIHHIGKKTWRGMTPKKIAGLIQLVAHIKGWPMYGKAPHPNEAPPPNHDANKERAKMSAAIRYAVIKRDGYRCRACGFAVQDGAHLHVDHIQPVSKGGLTEMTNLQTLCTVCNLGKRDQ